MWLRIRVPAGNSPYRRYGSDIFVLHRSPAPGGDPGEQPGPQSSRAGVTSWTGQQRVVIQAWTCVYCSSFYRASTAGSNLARATPGKSTESSYKPINSQDDPEAVEVSLPEAGGGTGLSGPFQPEPFCDSITPVSFDHYSPHQFSPALFAPHHLLICSSFCFTNRLLHLSTEKSLS